MVICTLLHEIQHLKFSQNLQSRTTVENMLFFYYLFIYTFNWNREFNIKFSVNNRCDWHILSGNKKWIVKDYLNRGTKLPSHVVSKIGLSWKWITKTLLVIFIAFASILHLFGLIFYSPTKYGVFRNYRRPRHKRRNRVLY